MVNDPKSLLKKISSSLKGNAFHGAKSHISAAINEIAKVEKKRKKRKSSTTTIDSRWKLDLETGMVTNPLTIGQQSIALKAIEDMIDEETKKLEKKSKDDGIYNKEDEDVILD